MGDDLCSLWLLDDCSGCLVCAWLPRMSPSVPRSGNGECDAVGMTTWLADVDRDVEGVNWSCMYVCVCVCLCVCVCDRECDAAGVTKWLADLDSEVGVMWSNMYVCTCVCMYMCMERDAVGRTLFFDDVRIVWM